MFSLHILPIIVVLALSTGHQTTPPKQASDEYVVFEVRALRDSSDFEFEMVNLTWPGKESLLQRLELKAPFKLSLNGPTYLIARGTKGKGKVGLRYKVDKEEKRAFQYLNEGEAIVLEFAPGGFFTGRSGTRWTEGKTAMNTYKLTFRSLTKE